MKKQCVYCEVRTGCVHALLRYTFGFKTLNETFNIADGSQVTPLYIAGDLNIQRVTHDVCVCVCV